MNGEAQAMEVPPEEQLDGLMTSFLSDRNELYIAQDEFTKSVRNGEDSAVVEEKANRLHECKREERRSLYLLRDRLSKVVDKLKIDGPVDPEGMATERETLTQDLDEKRKLWRTALMALRAAERVTERRKSAFTHAATVLAQVRKREPQDSGELKEREELEDKYLACQGALADAEIEQFDLARINEDAQHKYGRAYYMLASLPERRQRRLGEAVKQARDGFAREMVGQQLGHSATRSQDEAAS